VHFFFTLYKIIIRGYASKFIFTIKVLEDLLYLTILVFKLIEKILITKIYNASDILGLIITWNKNGWILFYLEFCYVFIGIAIALYLLSLEVIPMI
jgi:hypothetical protein